MHAQYSFSYSSETKRFRTHDDMDIFSCSGLWNSCPKFVHTFQLRFTYRRILYLSILLHLYILHTQNIQSLMQLKMFSLFLFYQDMFRPQWAIIRCYC
jgi:hypothetical protein